ncbi:hypothetical protein [Halobacillus sp. HZG1]|uniref:hypothetical protein n=1 Tax=Halobacillus sp. HZG1 TaxID=3111769 RepID=UPI002DB7FBA0|nr:hypothetical protein [Halobacillus sp. HZG1]
MKHSYVAQGSNSQDRFERSGERCRNVVYAMDGQPLKDPAQNVKAQCGIKGVLRIF